MTPLEIPEKPFRQHGVPTHAVEQPRRADLGRHSGTHAAHEEDERKRGVEGRAADASGDGHDRRIERRVSGRRVRGVPDEGGPVWPGRLG